MTLYDDGFHDGVYGKERDETKEHDRMYQVGYRNGRAEMLKEIRDKQHKETGNENCIERKGR